MDYNATTPVDPDVLMTMLPFWHTEFGNPSSSHSFGTAPAAALTHSRHQIKTHLNAHTEDTILFFGSATETINHVLQGALLPGDHLITSVIEHVAVLKTASYLQTHRNVDVTYVPVDQYGQVSVSEVMAALRPNTTLISLMHANNEIGTLQPLGAIAQALVTAGRRSQVWLHTDASQSVGKVPVDVVALGVDFLTMAGHKVYAPKGIGALYIKQHPTMSSTRPVTKEIRRPLLPLIHGATSQEFGQRAGTENVAYIAGLGKALALIPEDPVTSLLTLKTQLVTLLTASCRVPFRVNGHPIEVLPNTLSVSFQHLLAREILQALSPAVALSAGSACHASQDASGASTLSHVLSALALPSDYQDGTLRLSLGRFTTAQDVTQVAEALSTVVNGLATGSKLKDLYVTAPLSRVTTTEIEVDQESPVTSALIPKKKVLAIIDPKTGLPISFQSKKAPVVTSSPVEPTLSMSEGPMSMGVSSLKLKKKEASEAVKTTGVTGAYPATTRTYFTDTYLHTHDATLLGVFSSPARPSGVDESLACDSVVVCASTIFHPQGGGQPSDRGTMTWTTSLDSSSSVSTFTVVTVRLCPSDKEVIYHYGHWNTSSSPLLVIPQVEAGSDATTGVMTMHLDAIWRHTNAKCHSAGHLLDVAMAAIPETAHLIPSKGFHFASGPYVEYVGKVDASVKATLPAVLTTACQALITANHRSIVENATLERAAQLCDHYTAPVSSSQEKDLKKEELLRVVTVAGHAIPCGGTHVATSGELDGLVITRVKHKGNAFKVYYTV